MSQRCAVCAKTKQIGRISRHRRGVAGRQWAKRAQKTTKVFKPNLRPITLGGVKTVICMKCYKKLRKEQEALG